MKQVFAKLKDLNAAGESVVLCTIVDTDGSAPRKAGARMAVWDGGAVGTVGGGAVEYRAQRHAMELLRGGAAQAVSYPLHPDATDDIGMVCGGDVTVLFQPFRGTPSEAALLQEICAALAIREDSWLETRLLEDGSWQCRVLRRDDLGPEDKPRCRRKPVWDGRVLTEPLGAAGQVYIFGGGHVSQELVPVLHRAGFSVVVCENREEYAQKALFPEAEQVVLAEFRDLTRRFSIGPEDWVIIMTRGHRDDYQVLVQALDTAADYIGVIGSQKKAALTVQRLREDGRSEADIARIRTPIGLDIGAETPAEIAISITAQLIAHRSERQGREYRHAE